MTPYANWERDYFFYANGFVKDMDWWDASPFTVSQLPFHGMSAYPYPDSEHFPDDTYVDVPGLCKVATRAEIEAQGWSLNPGRYTGTAAVEDDRDRPAPTREPRGPLRLPALRARQADRGEPKAPGPDRVPLALTEHEQALGLLVTDRLRRRDRPRNSGARDARCPRALATRLARAVRSPTRGARPGTRTALGSVSFVVRFSARIQT